MSVEIKDYKFSFIMPIYNTEGYLSEAIDSVIGQTIGFEKNIQLILINDGSTDSSGDICKEYLKKYPKNIVYIEKSNGGVSSARNRGIIESRSEYTGFLDSDDVISLDTVEVVDRFFSESSEQVDIASVKLEFIGSKDGAHSLNYKYEGSKVVDVKSEYSFIQTAIGGTFIKTSVLKSSEQFDERLHYIEDGKLLTKIVMQKMAYGVVSGPVYYYRQRINGDSAMQKRLSDKRWYVDIPKMAFYELIEYSLKELGYIPRYVQYFIMYHLQGFFMQSDYSILSKGELDELKDCIRLNILPHIEDEVILSQKKIKAMRKSIVLSMKYGESVFSKATYSSGAYTYKGAKVYDYRRWSFDSRVLDASADEGELRMKAELIGTLFDGVAFGVLADGHFHEGVEVGSDPVGSFGEMYYTQRLFSLRVSLSHKMSLCFALKLPDSTYVKLGISDNGEHKLPRYNQGLLYKEFGAYLLCRTSNSIVEVVKSTKPRKFVKNLRLKRVL